MDNPETLATLGIIIHNTVDIYVTCILCIFIYMKFVNSWLLINKQPVIISCQIQTSNIPYFIKFDIVKSKVIKNGQSRDTGNIRHKTQNKDIQKPWTQKTKKMSNTDPHQKYNEDNICVLNFYYDRFVPMFDTG
jgi:hypothetical protein